MARGWNKAQIVSEIEEEAYNHNFFFGQGQEFDILEKNILLADEVWVFGNADGYDMYEYAKRKGLDIWQMG